LNVGALPSFSGATHLVPQLDLEYCMLVGTLALTAGALCILLFAM
jgi:hypothetical protein